MSDQPKPTTGEWTPQMVADIVEARKDVSVCVSVSDAHNAALAAEKEASKKAYAEGWRVGRDFAVEGQRDTAYNPATTDQPESTTGEATAKSMAANKIRGMHEQMQQNLADARKTKEYAEEKPVTGEWTAERIISFLGISQNGFVPDRAYGDLANRINATLALQQELHGDEMTNVQLQLQRQLAAERENISRQKSSQMAGLIAGLHQQIQQLHSQLAANQLALRTIRDNPAHSYESPKVANDALNSDTTELDAAIAAAQKPLVELLSLLRYDANGHITAWPNEKKFKAELSKVKEGK